MKVLLDEKLPHDLRRAMPGHEVVTVGYLGWKGIENGKLLAKAAGAGFDVLISLDRGLEWQHDRSQLPLAVYVLRAATNKVEDVSPFAPLILRELNAFRPRALIVISL